MRQMKANQRGKRGVRPDEPPEGDEPEESLDADGGDTLVDRGDGVRVLERGRRRDESIDRDLPDEPPPGWGGEAA